MVFGKVKASIAIPSKKENLPVLAKQASGKQGFVSFGIPGFDELFNKALPENSAILLTGSPGAGKTILAMQALYNKAREGRKCMYVSFEESEEKLLQRLNDFGMNFASVQKNLVIKRLKTFEFARDIEALLASSDKELKIELDKLPELRLSEKDFAPEFVVIDSITALMSGFENSRVHFRRYFEELLNYFEEKKVFVFLISEKGMPSSLTGAVNAPSSSLRFEHYLADGWVNLMNVSVKGMRQRGIEVIKMRGCNHIQRLVPLEIKSNKGIVIRHDDVIFEERFSDN